MTRAKIVPIILAAGSSRSLPSPKPLAPFGHTTALEIAIRNCKSVAQLAPPIVILGHRASEVRPHLPRGIRCIVNRRWRAGQLSSLLAALRRVPRESPFLVYPVDLPLITPAITKKLVAQFRRCAESPCIVMPSFRKRLGHPAIFSADLRSELQRANTAREVAYRDPSRIRAVPVRTAAIFTDFSSPAAYRRCLRAFLHR